MTPLCLTISHAIALVVMLDERTRLNERTRLDERTRLVSILMSLLRWEGSIVLSCVYVPSS